MYNIIYLSTMCDKNVYKQIVKNNGIGISPQMQNYNSAFYKSLKLQNCKVHSLSILPYKFKFHEYFVTDNNALDIPKYMNYKQGKHIGKMHTIINTIKSVNSIKKSSIQPVVIICDSLNLSLGIVSFYSKYFLKIKTFGIVTDYPDSSYYKKISFRKKIYKVILLFFLHKYSAYFTLSSYIGEKFKADKMILKGQIEISPNNDNILNEAKYNKEVRYAIDGNKIVLYSGSLTYENGIDNLLDAFEIIENESIELHIYGSGPLSDMDSNYSKNSNKIKFFGFIETENLRILQANADMLINPRPSKQDFVKFSFPSKNIEYMSSGTPLLTTNLYGMNEFNDFIFIIDDESPEGIANAIIQTFKSINLSDKSSKALEYIIDNYSTGAAGRRILSFIEEQVRK